MDIHGFLQSIDETDAAPVYFFGPARPPNAKASTYEPLLVQRAVERLIAKYVDPSMRDLAFTSYYADETDPGEIVSMAMTVPFLTERRVVLVQNADRYESEGVAKAMLAYLAAPSDLTVLILVASQIDKRTKFYKACLSAGVVVESPELKPAQVAQWIRDEIAVRGKTIEARAVDLMIHRCGLHLGDVNNAITVVCGYVGATETHIREKDVQTACSDVAEEEIWTLTDAIAASSTGESVRVLRELLGLGKSEFEIMGSINWLLKSAYAVAKYGGDAKINPYVAKKVKPLADKIGVDKMPAAFALCMDTEILLRSTGIDRALAMELLIIKLAAPNRRKQTAAAR